MKHIFINFNDIRQVCVKAILQYHGGIVFGKAVNKPHLLANTILSFVIVTLFGGPQFLCEVLTVRELDSKLIFKHTI